MSINLFKPVISEESIKAVTEVLQSGWIGLGPKTKQFEDDFSAYTGANHTVALNSATSSLHLAMKLIDLKEGDEVITTPLTFVSTNHAILYERGVPVFADVQPDTLNIDPEDIKRKITEKTKAIVCVHFAGYPCDLDEIHEIARAYNLVVIEDCAHAAGAEYKGKKIGSYSSINCFSFHAVKNLPMGDGGAVTTNNEFYDARLRKLRWLGIDKDTYVRTDNKDLTSQAYAWKYNVDEVGYKYHMNDISAAIGIEELKRLDKNNQKRRSLAAVYKEGLKNVKGIELLEYKDDRVTSQHICCVKADKRNHLVDHLKSNDINPGVHYLRNDLYPMYKEANLPNLESVHDKLISLPLHLHLSDQDIKTVVEVIKKGW